MAGARQAAVALALVLGAAPAAARLDPWQLHPRSLADCDAVVRAHPGEIEASFCWLRLAYTWPAGRKPVIAHLTQVLRSRPDDHLLRGYLGTLLFDESRLAEAEREFRAAAAGLRRDGHAEGEVNAITGITSILCGDGRFAEAERWLRRAHQAAEQSGNADDLSTADVWDADCAYVQADYGRARILFERALARIEAAPRTWRYSWIAQNLLVGLAATTSATGEHRRAFEAYRELVRRMVNNPYMQAGYRHGVASEAVRLAEEGELSGAEADALVREALDAAVKHGVHLWGQGGELPSRLLLSRRLGPTPEGIAEAERALAGARRADDRRLVAAALRQLAQHEAERDPAALSRALGRVGESIEVARRAGLRLQVAEGLLLQGTLLRRVGERKAADRAGFEALDELDRLRELQPDEVVRAGAGSEWAQAYALVAGQLLASAPADLPRAFGAMERMRARVLREALANREAQGPAGADELQVQRRETLTGIARLQRRLLVPGLPEAEGRGLLEELSALEREERRLADALGRAAPARSAAPEAASLAEVQAALGADEALLSFQTWLPAGRAGEGGSSWVVAVTRAGARAHPIPDAGLLARQVRLFGADLQRRDGTEGTGAARLHRDLLARSLAALPTEVTRLTLVADGPLQVLPFEALREAPAAPALAERYEVTMAPSAALWLRWRRSPAAPAAVPLLALADPAPGSPPAGERGGHWRTAAALGALPFARAEGKDIVALLGRGSRLAVGAEASERLVKSEALHRFGVVHFGAHAVVDEERPERSAVVLAPGAGDEDGLLQARDIAGLDLTGRLAVLAACSSASGPELRGEGVMSLARAFFVAGAHAVVGARWPIRDDEAAALLTAFYRRLGEGEPAARALSEARRERIRAGAPAAAWAGLVVLGNGDLRPVAPPVRPGLPLVAAVALGALALAAAALAWRLRR